MLKAYFAHPFPQRNNPDKKKIIEELKIRKIEVYDPFEHEEEVLKKYGVKCYYDNPTYELAREIWTRDLGAISHCDMVVLWLPDTNDRTIGCGAELDYAYTHGKFIQIISPLWHPSFSVYCDPDQFFGSIEDFINYRPKRWKSSKH